MKTVKRIVITGVTYGLGRAMAEKFMQLGHTVLGCGRTRSAIEEMNLRYARPNFFAMVDVTDDGAVKSWAEKVLSEHGPPDLLLNNAAVINGNAPLWEIAAEEFDRVVDVNVKGTVNVIRRFVPEMIKRKNGVIVNFSSGWGRSTSAQVAPYCATKWAIEGLTKALAQELPRGMAAVPLNPGIIDTPMLRSNFGDAAKGYPRPESWVERAVPMILQLSAKDNGASLSI